MSVTKIKAFLLHLYPELSRFKSFSDSHSITFPKISERPRKILRFSLPFIVLVVVPFVGINIGMFILSFFNPDTFDPTPIEIITPTPTTTYQSEFLPLSKSAIDFNPQLPDPLPPIFDDKISLEPIGN